MNIVSVAPAKHAYFPVKDKHGRSSMAVVLKYTFAVDPRGGVTLVPRGTTLKRVLCPDALQPNGRPLEIKRPNGRPSHNNQIESY